MRSELRAPSALGSSDSGIAEPASGQRLPGRGKTEFLSASAAESAQSNSGALALRAPIDAAARPPLSPLTWKSFRLVLVLYFAGNASSLVAARAGAPLPPAPARWVTDEAGVLSPGARAALDARLEAFEREQGTQIVVAVFRRLPAGEALEEWTVRVAQAWRVGRARQDDGAVLFVFVDDRQLRLEVGYGLEGTLTDLESKAILDDVLVPRLARGDWDGGIAAAADAIVAAVRGEYAPDPGARRGRRPGRAPGPLEVLFLVLVVLAVVIALARGARRGRWRSGGWGGGFGGGGFGGGFGGGGFGGGFSGGGGSFGGGGASSRW
jgi:uncharacterized protein